MDDWGEIELSKIEDSFDFWAIIDELINDNSKFYFNRRVILKAYKNGNLFGLRVEETDEMFKRDAIYDDIWCKDIFNNPSNYLLPCFCIKENDTAIIIWTHTRARKNGFAKKLVNLLGIKYAEQPLPESIEFWKKCNVLQK